jgi:dihydroorotate dehydrogenase (NAD+) catalytic subunit
MSKTTKHAGLAVDYCGITFPNPLILPSGIAQEIPLDHMRAIKAGAGGVTTKSLTIEPRPGHPFPRIIRVSRDDRGILNSVGLRGPGIHKGKRLIKEFLDISPIPVIVSIFAMKLKDFTRLAQELCPLKPAILELNLSCPNVDDEFGKSLGTGQESSAAAVRAVKKVSGKIPVIAKLTPNVPDIAAIAQACEGAGADGIAAINTVGPGMVIDIAKRKPVLGHKVGGLSGPAIKSIAVRCVYDIYEAVDIPIIGMGGVASWEDAVEMMMAGATLVGVGSATYFKGYAVFEEIKNGLRRYMKTEHLTNLTKIIGAAH